MIVIIIFCFNSVNEVNKFKQFRFIFRYFGRNKKPVHPFGIFAARVYKKIALFYGNNVPWTGFKGMAFCAGRQQHGEVHFVPGNFAYKIVRRKDKRYYADFPLSLRAGGTLPAASGKKDEQDD
jgi:hypothetical protein